MAGARKGLLKRERGESRSALVERAHQRGLVVHAYTVRNEVRHNLDSTWVSSELLQGPGVRREMLRLAFSAWCALDRHRCRPTEPAALFQGRFMAIDFASDPLAELAHLARLGVDGVFVDCPGTAREWLAARAGAQRGMHGGGEEEAGSSWRPAPLRGPGIDPSLSSSALHCLDRQPEHSVGREQQPYNCALKSTRPVLVAAA